MNNAYRLLACSLFLMALAIITNPLPGQAAVLSGPRLDIETEGTASPISIEYTIFNNGTAPITLATVTINPSPPVVTTGDPNDKVNVAVRGSGRCFAAFGLKLAVGESCSFNVDIFIPLLDDESITKPDF